MNCAKSIFLSLLVFLIISKSDSQTLSQTLRGAVVDKISQTPLPGVVVQLLNSPAIIVSTSDGAGQFKLLNVPVGKQSIKINLTGYKEIVMQNLTVNSGKELVITVNLEEDATLMNEVEVNAKVEKNKPLNEMSSVSTRAFSVEETQKFAGAFNDPARMANSFAGVVQAGDGNNHISIRGNSPNGLLWRMEGVEIPNPNHFSNVGTSGGGISILSSQLLNNSDFSTGAFAAEYGNALSGVFDLRLRKGNNEKTERTFQIGLLGIDAAMEGPLKKGHGGSYLVNYRYSTLSMLAKVGVPLGDAITNFQDISFNVSLPTQKFGTFGVFGFGGLSYQTVEAKRDSLEWKKESFSQYTAKFYSNTGAVGFTNTKLFGNQSYLKTVLALSGTENGEYDYKLDRDYKTFVKEFDQKALQNKITLSSTFTQKISALSNIRAGFIFNQLGFKVYKREIDEDKIFKEKIGANGNTQTMQAFFQWNYKLTSKLTSNLGIHYYQLLLNNSNSIEPRASLKYEVNQRNNFTIGYGLHSQLQPIGLYFTKVTDSNSVTRVPNKNLKLNKAHHMVIGYDHIINSFSHIKTELYYQYLFDVPITNDLTSNYSILNNAEGYYTGVLVNKGLGKNYGMELTYERFLHKNLYYLISGSLYDSKYRASSGQWYNTRFNTNYALTVTLGKEWTLSARRKNRIIGLNLKSVYVGGFRYTPIDLPASMAAGETRLQVDKTFEKRNPDYYRLDIKVSLKRNYKNLTSTLALDVQNCTNRKNVGGQYFNLQTGGVSYWYQAPLIPILSYKLEF